MPLTMSAECQHVYMYTITSQICTFVVWMDLNHFVVHSFVGLADPGSYAK